MRYSLVLRAVIGVLLAAQMASAEVYRIFADPASREVYAGSLVQETSGQGMLVGYPEGSVYSQSNAVWAFRLSALPAGKVIKSASFYVYYVNHYDKSGTVRYGPDESLYGIPFRLGSLTNPVATTDHFVGAYQYDTTDCVPLQKKFILNSELAVHPVWKNTNGLGSENLRKFLQTQYDNGAAAGDWILLRQNCEYIDARTTREHFGDSYYLGGQYLPYIEYELTDDNALAPEITPGLEPVMAPIQHQPYYLQERELFGYNPRFELNCVTFGFDNRPYIRGEWGVQTLGSNGRWVLRDLVAPLRQAFPTWSGMWGHYGSGSDDRITFDNDGDAYLMLFVDGIGFVMAYSHDQCRTWQTYSLASLADLRMEFRDGHNDLSKPPVILGRVLAAGGGSYDIMLYVPSKNADGTLTIPAGIKVNGSILPVSDGLNAGKGASNLTITSGNKTHIVFGGHDRYLGIVEGTPVYIVTYDRTAGTMSSSVYLGSAGTGDPDGHNWPAITIDSGGYLHVILSAHGEAGGQYFKYRKSNVSNSITGGWTTAYNFQPGLTYPSLLCDANDTLHLIARDYWEPEMRLKYQRKPAGGSWSSRQVLVIPWDAHFYTRAPYSHYAANFNLDFRSRLFVCYYNKRNLNKDTVEYNPLQFAAFNAKYVCDGGVDDEWHDPAMLMSDNGGASWRLAVTNDFVNGILP